MAGNVYTCIGLRSVNFKGSDGNQVEGYNIFLTFEDKHIEGLGCEKVFVPMQRFIGMSFIPKVGSSCTLSYNKYGKVQDIDAV